MEFSKARILEWVAFPSPGDLPNLGIEPRSPTLQAVSSPAGPLGKPSFKIKAKLKVTAESFLLSFSPDPVKKKKKSQELQN